MFNDGILKRFKIDGYRCLTVNLSKTVKIQAFGRGSKAI
jgi:hypothetical protein